MRELRFSPFGRAWIAPSGEWPALSWEDSGSKVVERRFEATGAAADCSVAVSLVCQTASGGSYFARLGGSMSAGAGAGDLLVRVRAPGDSDGLVQAVLAGIETVEQRPKGTLDLSRFRTHVVDWKRWAWGAAAATLVRWCGADVIGVSDDDLIGIASEAARYRG